MLIQIKNGATKSRYPHQCNQTGFVGDTWTSSPIVRDQFLKIALECKIDNDGMRRSSKSAIVMIRTKQTQPARRDFDVAAQLCGASLSPSTNRSTITSTNRISAS